MNNLSKIVNRNNNNLVDLISLCNGDIFFGNVIQFLDYKDLGRVRECSLLFWKMQKLEVSLNDRRVEYCKNEQIKLLQKIRDNHYACREKIHSKDPGNLSEIVSMFEFCDYNLRNLLNHEEGIYSMHILDSFSQVNIHDPLMTNPFMINLLKEISAVNVQYVQEWLFEQLFLVSEQAVAENLECFILLKQLFISIFASFNEQDYDRFRQVFIKMQLGFENYQKYMYIGDINIVNIYEIHFYDLFEPEFSNQSDKKNRLIKLKNNIKSKISKNCVVRLLKK